MEQLGASPKPEHVVRARAALRTLLGEIWLQPNGDHLMAHVEVQNQTMALLSDDVANGGSGGRIRTYDLRVMSPRDRAFLKVDLRCARPSNLSSH